MTILKNILAVVGLICMSGLFIFSMQKAPSDDTIGKEEPLY
jgi:membrane-bound lytic murein transglycosylase D